MRPKFALFMVPFGLFSITLSNTLNASMRNSRRRLFTLDSRRIFASDMSVLKVLGPRSGLRGALPNCPRSGRVHSDTVLVLNHCAIFSSRERLSGSVGSPFRFGRCAAQPPQPMSARSTPETTLIGVPDR